MSRKKKSPQQLQEIATQFECFVAILCYNTGLKTTRWDVTYRKKNGSKRQVDVEYVRRNGIYRQKTVIECKYSSNPDAKIGVHHFMEGKDQKKDQKKKIKENLIREVDERRLYVDAYKAILVTNAYYTKELKADAEEHKVQLWDREVLEKKVREARSLFGLGKVRLPNFRSLEQMIAKTNVERYAHLRGGSYVL
ncbi:hypothetical protein HN695_02645 [Candidatus Woesearchaeota archaeon]|jgi:hypothetical protein|nr:hypothetical protein [Candidatus Woesearchaeota archaeon]MBT5271987.1 hypothetical protein [Candidatus Woesearchaeota archaeon]MBT6040893.1 hypothetical protein [Candidatus Woesearchaeota archaeon]MBT6336769.1 hypothetical protein [Candidatus Woesearchaeota archaeon]MBT7927210.1 hypothetical protein [Candidatus Woesearchaeota archaeon]